jgi:hypothetical protein
MPIQTQKANEQAIPSQPIPFAMILRIIFARASCYSFSGARDCTGSRFIAEGYLILQWVKTARQRLSVRAERQSGNGQRREKIDDYGVAAEPGTPHIRMKAPNHSAQRRSAFCASQNR